ncbi:MAG: class I tRNA ligase family protein, partial [Chloroflexi bacterium]|nr:class I tRNA ligase family protein [Chloroflexota bacterium]
YYRLKGADTLMVSGSDTHGTPIEVEANMQNATVTGNVALRTQAGTVDFRASEIIVEGNNTVDLHSNAGSVNIDMIQTKSLQGNLKVNAATELGSVNVGVQIDGDVGAKLISQTNLGSIHAEGA